MSAATMATSFSCWILLLLLVWQCGAYPYSPRRQPQSPSRALSWRGLSFPNTAYVLDTAPPQYPAGDEEEQEEDPAPVLDYEDVGAYDQVPFQRQHLYDILLKEAAYEDVPESDTWYEDDSVVRDRDALDSLLDELASRIHVVEKEPEPEAFRDEVYGKVEEESDPAVEQLRALAKKSEEGRSQTPSSTLPPTTLPPRRYVQKGQKEVALLRPPSNPGMFSSAPLEDQLTALRRTRGGSYEVLRQLIAKEKRQEKMTSAAAASRQHAQQKRFVTSEDSLTKELHTLKKTQA